jgi:hypothetical protein
LGSVMALAARYQQARSSLDTLDALMKRPRDRDASSRYVVNGLQGQTNSPVFDGNYFDRIVSSLKN